MLEPWNFEAPGMEDLLLAVLGGEIGNDDDLLVVNRKWAGRFLVITILEQCS